MLQHSTLNNNRLVTKPPIGPTQGRAKNVNYESAVHLVFSGKLSLYQWFSKPFWFRILVFEHLLYNITFPYMSIFTCFHMFPFPKCSLELITHIDENIEMAHISLLIKPFIKTKPVLKTKLAGGFNGMLLKSWTSWCHVAKVMFSWFCMKFHEIAWKHDFGVMTPWCSWFYRHSIKTAC